MYSARIPVSLAVFAVSDPVKSSVFPLVLLLLGGLITGVLYPMLTAARQRDRKGREIRTTLVADISEEVRTTIQFVQLGSASVALQDFNASYKRWEIASSVIATKREAYFPKRDLGRRWTDYANRVTDFYALSGIRDGDRRRPAAGCFPPVSSGRTMRTPGGSPHGTGCWTRRAASSRKC
jgi:hypothetical protein